MTAEHWDVAEAAINRLARNPSEFAVIRKFAALLNADVATLLFINPKEVVVLDVD
jgi:hypothetical protein